MNESPIVTRSQSKSTSKMPKQVEDGSGYSTSSSADSVPVFKWGLSFDGSTDVRHFIERVDELAIARNVSSASLFSSAIDLFSGSALDWFRVNRVSFKSWDEIIVALKDEFELLDHERRLVAQIRNTAQLQKENLGSFITRVMLLNNRLSSKLPDDEILEILQCNMLPRYIQKLSLSVISDINGLKKLGKMIELADSRSDSRTSTLNANLYNNNNNARHYSHHNAPTRGNSRNTSNNHNYRNVQFPNNNNSNIPNYRRERQFSNHNNLSPSNNVSREVRCFRCGRLGVKAPACNCRHSKN